MRLAHHLVVLQRRCKCSRVAGPTIRGCCGLSAGPEGNHLLLQRAHALFVEQVKLEGDDLKLRSTACNNARTSARTHIRCTADPTCTTTRACRHTPSTRMANEDDYGMVWHGSHRLCHQTVQCYCDEPREPFRYSWVGFSANGDRTLLPFSMSGNATQRKAPWAQVSAFESAHAFASLVRGCAHQRVRSGLVAVRTNACGRGWWLGECASLVRARVRSGLHSKRSRVKRWIRKTCTLKTQRGHTA